jgi:hypothetical protein
MSNFIQIIYTRFNVPTENWDNTLKGKKPLTEEWLTHRFELFHEYSLPSFKNQTNQDFLWLVFFDKNTPEKFLTIIKNIEKEYPKFQPHFVSDFKEMQTEAIRLSLEKCPEDKEYIISAEIDNDDVLNSEYIAITQSLFRPTHNLVIDIRRGYQMEILDNGKRAFNEFYYLSSPFVQLIEKKSEFKSLLQQVHIHFRHFKNQIVYDAKPLFTIVLHNNNLLNHHFKTKFYWFPNMEGFETIKYTIDYLYTTKKNILHYSSILKKLIFKK